MIPRRTVWPQSSSAGQSVRATPLTVSIRLLGIFFLTPCPVLAQTTYTSIANGNWGAASTWQDGLVPPREPEIPATATILIRHQIVCESGSTLKLRGTIRIEPITGTTARLSILCGENVEVLAGGKLLINGGSYYQPRFVAGDDGQPYDGNNPTGAKNSGSLKNIGGLVEVDYGYVEIPESWTTESGGSSIFRNSCLKTGQNYSLSGESSFDRFENTVMSIGWHGSGNFAHNGGTAEFEGARIQLAGESGNFQLNGGVARGQIDYIALRNEIVPFTGSGSIFASSSLDVSSGLTLDAYWRGSGGYIPNGKFSGLQTDDFASGDDSTFASYFPGVCLSGGDPPSTPTETPTETPSPTVSPLPTDTPTETATPTETVTPTQTATPTATTSATATPTASVTATGTATATPTFTATATPTPSQTATLTVTPTATSTASPSQTPLPSSTPTPTPNLPDLILQKAALGSFSKGGTGRYSLAVCNIGTTTANGPITVVDVLATGVTVSGAPTAPDWDCGQTTSDRLECTQTTDLPQGECLPTIFFDVDIANGSGGVIVNTSSVTCGSTEITLTNNEDTVRTRTAASPVPISRGSGPLLALAAILLTVGLVRHPSWRRRSHPS